MIKITKNEKIATRIYEYLKNWLNSQDIMVPGYVYKNIKDIIDMENPPRKKCNKKLPKIWEYIEVQNQISKHKGGLTS